jgi:hypothetical protein
MHPDQHTPDDHRTQAPDSAEKTGAPRAPELSQQAEVDTTSEGAPAATEVEDGARVAEAGHGYVGRQMADRLKSGPRVEDRDEAVDEDPTTPADD